MKLFEHEGKELFKSVEIPVPNSLLVSKIDLLDRLRLNFPVVIKAQTLSGKRGKRGLVKKIEDNQIIRQAILELMSKKTADSFENILIEEAVDIIQELFVSITYSTKTRGPVLLFSTQGGIEVEEIGDILEIGLEFGKDIPNIDFKKATVSEAMVGNASNKYSEIQIERVNAKVWNVINKLWKLFQEKDLFLAEINPLVITTKGQVIALDAKVVTDDASDFRQLWDLPERNMMGTKKSFAEIESEKIDKDDHRGAVGRVYLDLEGDIGVIAAGGGASLVAMDALVSYRLKPANYTEFSGNPPSYKVKRLTEIVLGKENLKGAILIGGKANFTDQVETLAGFLEALIEINPTYPIVVRRDGPRMSEAKKMLEDAAKKYGWKLEVYDSSTSIIDAVKKLVDLVK